MTKVLFSDLLPSKFPDFYAGISNVLDNNEIIHSLIKDTKDIWCRDYMPVRGADGELVLFRYYPSYLRDSEKGKKFITPEEVIFKSLGGKCKTTGIILDGGAIEICGKTGIVSDRIFRDNYEIWKNDEKSLLKKLQDELSLDKLVVIPQHPYDFTGHVDGLARFIDEKTVLINDLMPEFRKMKNDSNSYPKKLVDQWYYSFKTAFYNARLETRDLVSMMGEVENDIDAYGIYLNFLLLDNLVVVPGFDHDNDEVARIRVKKLYKRDAVTIQATELAKEGGIINCVTWTKSI